MARRDARIRLAIVVVIACYAIGLVAWRLTALPSGPERPQTNFGHEVAEAARDLAEREGWSIGMLRACHADSQQVVVRRQALESSLRGLDARHVGRAMLLAAAAGQRAVLAVATGRERCENAGY